MSVCQHLSSPRWKRGNVLFKDIKKDIPNGLTGHRAIYRYMYHYNETECRIWTLNAENIGMVQWTSMIKFPENDEFVEVISEISVIVKKLFRG